MLHPNILSGKRVLIVLDDVNEIGQLEDLCGNCEWFGQGSVIIITTRDVGLLNLFKVDYVYKMEEMDENESLELFCLHAFGEPNPREDFNELARKAVAYCGGLPLALEVLGSHLFRTETEWESVLSKLKMIPNDQIQQKLRISFDELYDHMEKHIFLDICCFFIGKDRAYVTEILNGCGLHADIGITVLIEHSLVKIEKNNKLGMHPLLRQMGREIIRESSIKEPGKRSRLWFHEDVLDVLIKNTGTEAIEGLALQLHLSIRDCFKAEAFQEMKSLRLLRLDHVQLTGDYGYLSKQLRWIYWKGFPLNYIPNNFYLEGVIAIDLKHSNLKLLWKKTQVLQWLKILNLSHSKYLTETPDFSGLPSLEKLILKDCPSLHKEMVWWDPYLFTNTVEGHSVYFTVPEGCRLKGMALYVDYSSTSEIMANKCLISVVMVNYTKCSIQIFKRDTVISFNDEDWQGIESHLGPGDKVQIFVLFDHGLVEKTAVYLTCDESIGKEMEPSPEPKRNSIIRFMKCFLIIVPALVATIIMMPNTGTKVMVVVAIIIIITFSYNYNYDSVLENRGSKYRENLHMKTDLDRPVGPVELGTGAASESSRSLNRPWKWLGLARRKSGGFRKPSKPARFQDPDWVGAQKKEATNHRKDIVLVSPRG